MSDELRIVQISDCHLSGDPARDYRGSNPHRNLKALLREVKSFAPDFILATGDLSEDASPASYQGLQKYLDQLAWPVLALPGNHDDIHRLAQVFPGSPVRDIAVTEHDKWQIIRLNSCLEQRPEGRLSQQTLNQLQQVLQCEPGRPRLLAMHHQPIPAGSPWIDRYRLFKPQVFLDLIGQAPGVKAVVWGHVHQAHETEMNATAMLGSPSSAINSSPGVKSFVEDVELGPACRWLELGSGGSIRTGIIQVAGNSGSPV